MEVELLPRMERMEPLRTSSLFRKDDGWGLYVKVMEHDYMSHRDLYDALCTFLASSIKARMGGEEQRRCVLDLGCGDSFALARVLAANPQLAAQVQQYKGVDLSQRAMAASAVAMRRVLPAGARIGHEASDMLQSLRATPAASYDVVVAGFALHHYVAADKQEIMQHIARVLCPGGCFLLVDVFAEPAEQEPRAYQARFRDAVQHGFEALNADEKQQLLHHVMTYDLPETAQAWVAWMEDALQRAPGTARVLCERGGLFKALAIQAPAA